MRIPRLVSWPLIVSVLVLIFFPLSDLGECVMTFPCAAYYSTPAIFVGKVLSVSGPNGESPLENRVVLEPGQPISVKFEVLKAIKGIESSQVTVVMRAGSSECCYSFKRSKTYLVFARRQAEELVTSGCDPNKLVGNLEKDGDVQVLLSMKKEINIEAQKQLCVSSAAKRK